MQKYVCDVCGYIYDPEVGDPDGGIEPGTSFEDIPDDWLPGLRRRKGRLQPDGIGFRHRPGWKRVTVVASAL